MKVGNLVRFVHCKPRIEVGDLALILEVRDLDWTTMCIVLHQKTGRITTCRTTQVEKVS
jgi:hypothetical protein